jgi:hypothetical protein
MKLSALLSVSFATLLLFVASVTAAPPTRFPFEVDETFPGAFLTGLCGFPVYVHVQGSGITTLYYDESGTQVVREIDTLAEGLTTTIFSPLELGGTGKSFTEVMRAPGIFQYPEGTEIGDLAILVVNGVQLTSGPGNPRLVGHEVYEGEIIGYTPEGIPLVDITALISQSGQFDVDAVLTARCAALAP